ncbi:hypothetical protein RUESEDTHA_03944 [Ruegeria sp. THAF57]|nr:hypothetical protein RUESEDTHA_03944 [Ruegeria sp. THAF57]
MDVSWLDRFKGLSQLPADIRARLEEFFKFRSERDAGLDMPKLIIPSLRVNVWADQAPRESDGNPMLKVPVNTL